MAILFKLAVLKNSLVLSKQLLLSVFFSVYSFIALSNDNLDKARNFFLKGEYEKAMQEASTYNSADAKILHSRILSIYTHFYIKDHSSEEMFLKAYKIAKTAIEIAPENDEAQVEAAHALGRYGQKIGIMAAITKGVAERVRKYLNKALDINPNNILANLSKGIWHAEIINQAGRTLAGAVYGAKIEKAVYHFDKVETHRNSNEIGVLFELAYGYSLLNEGVYFKKSKVLIERLLKEKISSDMDSVYKKKALMLLEILP